MSADDAAGAVPLPALSDPSSDPPSRLISTAEICRQRGVPHGKEGQEERDQLTDRLLASPLLHPWQSVDECACAAA